MSLTLVPWALPRNEGKSLREKLSVLFDVYSLLLTHHEITNSMKEIILKIPDQKVDFVLELIEQLGLEVSSEEMEIPTEHKAIVRERIKTAKPEDMIPWEEARKQFTFKTKA
ncbi:MAG: hypothetical protein WD022_08605 [Balneolaceae bacterium]